MGLDEESEEGFAVEDGLAVGALKGIERNRIDSILAVGRKERMCRWSCFCSG